MSNNPWKIEQQKINPFINKDGDHGELGTPVNGVVGNAVDAVQQVGNALGSLANAPYLVDTTGNGNDRTLQTVSTIGEALKENPIVNNPAFKLHQHVLFMQAMMR